MSGEGLKPALNAEQRRLIAVLPAATGVLSLGIVLFVTMDDAAKWVGGALMFAGLALQLFLVVRLLKAGGRG